MHIQQQYSYMGQSYFPKILPYFLLYNNKPIAVLGGWIDLLLHMLHNAPVKSFNGPWHLCTCSLAVNLHSIIKNNVILFLIACICPQFKDLNSSLLTDSWLFREPLCTIHEFSVRLWSLNMPMPECKLFYSASCLCLHVFVSHVAYYSSVADKN